MEREEAIDATASLLRRCRWGALATIAEDGSAVASQVAVASQAEPSQLILHLSQLAEHTRNLLVRPRVSLSLGEPDTGRRRDPQTLSRVTIVGTARLLNPGLDQAGHAAARECYLGKLPAAEPRFAFGDFGLYAVLPERGQFVGGFARAFTLDAAAVALAVARSTGRSDPI